MDEEVDVITVRDKDDPTRFLRITLLESGTIRVGLPDEGKRYELCFDFSPYAAAVVATHLEAFAIRGISRAEEMN